MQRYIEQTLGISFGHAGDLFLFLLFFGSAVKSVSSGKKVIVFLSNTLRALVILA